MKPMTNKNLLSAVAFVLLAGAVISAQTGRFSLPFAYYQFMNWSVAGAALMIAWGQYGKAKQGLVWLYTLVAILFNPLASIYLSARGWLIADIAVIVLLGFSLFVLERQQSIS